MNGRFPHQVCLSKGVKKTSDLISHCETFFHESSFSTFKGRESQIKERRDERQPKTRNVGSAVSSELLSFLVFASFSRETQSSSRSKKLQMV